jgi:APA family basic amino acid/polyamine antiporter
MARDGHLPTALAEIHPRFGVPHRAEIAVGVVVAVVAAVADVRAAIGFSSFAVLVYYGIANASAATLGRRVVPAAGFAGCLLLAIFLPPASVLAGTAVLAMGAAIYAVRRLR